MHVPSDMATAPTGPEIGSWKRILRDAIRDPDELIDHLSLPGDLRPAARRVARAFPLIAPRGFVDRMEIGDPDDPLLLQVLPLAMEEVETEGYSTDPVGDARATLAPGLIHKYSGRALLIANPSCAVHCRYCFRRHFPYEDTPRNLANWEPAMQALRADRTIREVILSGGDPLMLTDTLLSRLVRELESIPHISRLRIHSRLPIVIPERVDESLLTWIRSSRLSPWMVIHCNHPREIDRGCEAAIARLVDSGVPVLNQAVLLRGVNDSAETLIELCERLADLRVQPYYLHQLDPVQGAAHFDVPDERGLQILKELRDRLPGYAVPRFVRDEPGALSKSDIE